MIRGDSGRFVEIRAHTIEVAVHEGGAGRMKVAQLKAHELERPAGSTVAAGEARPAVHVRVD